LPADGTALPNGGTGDFGTSPICGQLLDKPLLAFIKLHGVPNANHNSGSKLAVENLLVVRRAWSGTHLPFYWDHASRKACIGT
jgi:hypothetical protein